MRRGFTLVEVLITLAIIGLIAAIILPVLSRARENGRKIACLSNMQQLGKAFQMYVLDHDRRYPGAGQFQKWGNGAHWVAGKNGTVASNGMDGALAKLDSFEWTGNTATVEQGAIFSYVKSPGVYFCPSNADGKKKRLSYSMNCAIAGIREVRITEPAAIIVLIDEEKNNDGFWYAVDNASSTDSLTTSHNGGGNLLLADGHAKFYSFKAFPLDSSAGPLKTRLTGTPRFRDEGFHKDPTKGYYFIPGADPANPEGTSPFGSCEVPG